MFLIVERLRLPKKLVIAHAYDQVLQYNSAMRRSKELALNFVCYRIGTPSMDSENEQRVCYPIPVLLKMYLNSPEGTLIANIFFPSELY